MEGVLTVSDQDYFINFKTKKARADEVMKIVVLTTVLNQKV